MVGNRLQVGCPIPVAPQIHPLRASVCDRSLRLQQKRSRVIGARRLDRDPRSDPDGGQPGILTRVRSVVARGFERAGIGFVCQRALRLRNWKRYRFARPVARPLTACDPASRCP